MKFDTRSTDGTFSGLDGVVIFSPDDLSNAVIDVSVDAKTIDTGMKKKDEHARSSDWLNAEKYPKITFKSSSFTKSENGYLVSGSLTLHGITKEVSIPFLFENDVFSGSFTINRSDYGVTGSGMKAKFVGEEIEISYNIPTSLK
jgi:polyisoprenoid-binding protein YceI